MRQTYLIRAAWLVVILLAVWLRATDLDVRPIHADEATGARIFSERLEGNYAFNPKHFHGPALSLTTLPFAWLAGESNWQELQLSTLRWNTVFAGLLLVLSPLLWRKYVGNAGAVAAGALLATSPLLVYYNRMYIHESWLALFGIITLAAFVSLLNKPSRWRGIYFGLWAGLMFATKETVAISAIAGLAGAIYYRTLGEKRTINEILSNDLPALGWAVASALLVSSFIYTNAFRDLGGIVDAFRTYFVYETTPGHEKPTSYYLHLLLWPKATIGLWWSEAGIAILAAGALLINRHKPERSAIAIFIAIAAAAHFVIYSLISYKTPWLMLLPWALLCLLGGAAFNEQLWHRHPAKWVLLIAFLITIGYQGKQSLLANGRFANDSRNPYVYVPTSKNAASTGKWLKQIESLYGDSKLSPIGVVGSGYWPLPWYLREFETIGYWPETVPELSELPAVFAMPAEVESCDQLLKDSHTRLPRGLRLNHPTILYLRNDLWELWSKHAADDTDL